MNDRRPSTRAAAAFALALALAACAPAPPARADNHALLVGVETYREELGFDPLSYSEDDAEGLMKVLTRDDDPAARFDVTILTTGKNVDQGTSILPSKTPLPTRDKILAELDAVCGRANRGGATLFVFLAGHGKSFPAAEGGSKSVFCPYDVRKRGDGTFENGIDVVAEVAGRMNRCNATNKYLFVDACRDRPRGDGTPFRIDRDRLKSVSSKVHVVFSCSDDEKARERSDVKHGIFSHFLIQGLKGWAAADGELTIDALFGFVNGKMQGYARRNALKELQKPEWIPGGAVTARDVVARFKPIGGARILRPSDLSPDQSGTTFENVTFTGNFRGYDFRRATFNDCRFEACRFQAGTLVTRARFQDCVFDRADFSTIDTRNTIVIGPLPREADAPWSRDKKPRTLIGDDF